MDLLSVLDMMGTFVFAISGVLTAIDKKFDLVGSTVIGFATAVGGGTLRDILIGKTPVGWMLETRYVFIIIAAVPICYIFKSTILKLRKSVFLFDTIGIGLFTILGLQKTLGVGLSPLIAVLMGIVSAVFGGILRDVLCNEVPLIFRKEIYASACFIGAVVYLAGESILPHHIFNTTLSIATVIIIRYLSVKNNWSLAIHR